MRHTTPALFALALLLLTSFASADVLTYTDFVTFSFADVQQIVLPQINLNPGDVLTQVTIYIYHSGAADFSIDNDSGYSVNARARLLRDWAVNQHGVTNSTTYVWNSAIQNLAPESAGPDGATMSFSGPDGYNFGLQGYSNLLAYQVNVDSSQWADYIGGGTVGFDIEATTVDNLISFVGAPPNAYQSQVLGGNPDLTVRMTVEYTYNYVPEPGTMALMSLGLVGVGVWRRRRAAAAA